MELKVAMKMEAAMEMEVAMGGVEGGICLLCAPE